jgi:CheY-like chemotaxis protein
MVSHKYKRVMVVDDSSMERFITVKMIQLNKIAAHVVEMKTAQEALDHLSGLENDIQDLPEIIFLDLHMPGMDGFDFLRAYRLLPHAVQKRSVIMLTSSILLEDKLTALNDPHVIGFINKPLSVASLKGILGS